MRIVKVLPEAGEVFEFPYPFVRKPCPWDENGAATWNPGTRIQTRGPENYDAVADGMGKQRLTIVGTYRPGKFPTRVFFTRKWIDPDGGEFGKRACRSTTVSNFRGLLNGYRHAFELVGKVARRKDANT